MSNSENDNEDSILPQGTLFIEDVDRIDCAVFDPSAGIIGQSWHVDVSVSGELDANGFVHDFTHIKNLVKQVLKASLDHALLIPVLSKQVFYQEGNDVELWTLRAKARLTGVDTEYQYSCPKGAVYPLRGLTVTQNLIEKECSRLIRHRLPSTVQGIEVRLRREDAEPTAAFFHYTHGIPGHEGLCQRLFHGHRSRIEIHVGDERRPDLEHYVARDLFASCVHIATPGQLVGGGATAGRREDSKEPIKLAYSGSFGNYEAVLPADKVFFVERETSIECLTRQIALHIAEVEQTDQLIRISCYEGIGKGASSRIGPRTSQPPMDDYFRF
jgi:6-pyruvoyl-tetrahydropterin synthase